VAGAIICATLLVGSAAFYEWSMAGHGAPSATSAITSYSVCFSPGENCASQILDLIAEANSSIHIMIYTFTNTAIANSLVQAKARGVDVKVVMDGSEANSDNLAVVAVLDQGGVPLRTYSPAGGIVHDKVAIVDGKVVITGSYNWSYSANDYNDENLLVLHSAALAVQYEANFEALWNQSQ
jgi:phosphatidylserine/phosphatidylglycerophosphate/cardiolipin synthase-like enzyme